jgi:hypothetical protein
MPYGTVNADVIQTSTSGGILGAGNASIMKNRIINGNMLVSQRNGTSTVTPSSGNYTLDRWNAGLTQASKFSVAQSTTAPTGFINSLLVTSLSAYSITSTDIFVIRQPIEGLNTYDLAWGTASAKTVTLSFQVYSSLTGTFGGSLENDNADRSYPFTYTISSANTWTSVSVTITGCTDGTWLTTNAVGILLNLGLGVGSSKSGTAGAWANADYRSATGATSVVGTNGATFYITGVQLEVGSSATGYEYRIYGTEFANCQRYYNKILLGDTATSATTGISSFNYISTLALAYFVYPVAMRTIPSLVTTGSTSNYQVLQNGGSVGLASVPTGGNISSTQMQINFSTAGGLNLGQGSACRGNNASSNDWLALSAEL